ncbi:DUF3052 family protein [Phenylobacterium kunshanense]|uniref:DUF3052 domain-containing protein n=1 Tax=Phenylobacterium kunshanense TaxID=1445034 RepID=A0A328BIH4_9CAUL|nr:DUF3052 family protein [Phenylobacterium kunshanense]RAK66429.1 DUF3052 domain-containing protein [Phenylobacterium kunshanense]
MGKEIHTTGVFADGPDEGRLQWEAPKLVFRGRERRVWSGEGLKGLRADAGDLVLADGSRVHLGEVQAARWADAIANPKGRLDKLGVKPGMRVCVLEVEDGAFPAELAERDAAPIDDLSGLDLLFYGADSVEALGRIETLVPALAEKGALWVVSRKGKAATVRDVDVMAAAKSFGLVDNKVVGFSETLTALRFVRRRV